MWSNLRHKCIQSKNEIQKTKINVQQGQWLEMTLTFPIDSMTLNINFNCYLIYNYINFRRYIEKNNKWGYYLRLAYLVISKAANIQFLFLDQLFPYKWLLVRQATVSCQETDQANSLLLWNYYYANFF